MYPKSIKEALTIAVNSSPHKGGKEMLVVPQVKEGGKWYFTGGTTRQFCLEVSVLDGAKIWHFQDRCIYTIGGEFLHRDFSVYYEKVEQL